MYDVAQPSTSSGQRNSGSGDYGSVLKITSANSDCHQYSVSSVAWYPIDTGLFVTGSFDHQVKVRSLCCVSPPNHCPCHQVQINDKTHHSQVWDANLGQAACSFTFPDRVYGVAMSAIAATHCLIAVVGGDPHIKLCDPATGGFTHSLVGHREPVWAVSWSLESEYHLVTGGCDGQVNVLFLLGVLMLLSRPETGHVQSKYFVSKCTALHYCFFCTLFDRHCAVGV